MTRARLKTELRDVWQHCGWNARALPAWARNCTENRADGLYLVRLSGKQLIERGDWIIRDLDAEPLWMTDKDFRREYQIAD
jgi:hypothetical protein